MLQLVASYNIPFAIKAALDLNLFETLKDQSFPVEALAEKLNVNSINLKRLLHALISVGIIKKEKDCRYHLTKLGQTLVPGPAPGSIEGMARYMLDKNLVLPVLDLSYSIATNKAAFDKVHGATFYDYCKKDSQFQAVLNRGMENYTALDVAALLKAYSFSPFHRIVDIGGGLGYTLAAILEANPGATGILYDLPGSVQRAGEYLKDRGLEDRCELTGGDMFKSIPPGNDLYFISKVLNDWGDEHVLKILKNIRKAMGEGAKLILFEMVRTDNSFFIEETLRDLTMLMHTPGGKVRSAEEFTELLTAANLKLDRIVRTSRPFSMIECEPVGNPR